MTRFVSYGRFYFFFVRFWNFRAVNKMARENELTEAEAQAIFAGVLKYEHNQQESISNSLLISITTFQKNCKAIQSNFLSEKEYTVRFVIKRQN